MAMQAQQIQDQGRVEVRTRFGTLPVNKENLLDFPEGLPGFEDLHRFVLLHDEGNESIFYLQSLDDPGIRLPVTSPHWFRVDYEIELDDKELETLQLDHASDTVVLVTLADDEASPVGYKVNFHGPIILNSEKRIGIQKPMPDAQSSLLIRSH